MSAAIVTSSVTTTYASRAASSTAKPPTPIATPRARGRAGSVVLIEETCVVAASGSTDGHRDIDLGQGDCHRGRGRGPVGRGVHDGLDQMLGLLVQPYVALDARGHAGDERAGGGVVEVDGDPVRVHTTD